MASKEEAVEKLKKKGYKVKLESGIVFIFYDNHEEYKSISDTIKWCLLFLLYCNRTI